jgi:hypothetical protein
MKVMIILSNLEFNQEYPNYEAKLMKETLKKIKPIEEYPELYI